MIISLGGTCCIAHQLRKKGFSQHAYPFDWIRIANMGNINYLLEHNFENFLNREHFIFLKKSNKFDVDSGKESYIYKNKYCKFFHEFDKYIDDENFLCFRQKYDRRIKRLYNILMTEKKILFIREVIRNLSINKLQKFKEIINNINPDLEWSLILICSKKKSHKFQGLDNIKVIESPDKESDWGRDELDWNKIFTTSLKK